jgi:hypothetical protein
LIYAEEERGKSLEYNSDIRSLTDHVIFYAIQDFGGFFSRSLPYALEHYGKNLFGIRTEWLDKRLNLCCRRVLTDGGFLDWLFKNDPAP